MEFIELLIAGLIAFLHQIKTGLIGYATLEVHRGFKGNVFTMRQYAMRFGITLGVLYSSTFMINILGVSSDTGELIKMLVGGFAVVFLDILENKVPDIFSNGIDKISSKK